MRPTGIALLLLLVAFPVFAQTLPEDLRHKLEVFKLKAELHETKVELVKATAEKLLAQAQLEGLQLRVEQQQLELEALKDAPKGATLNWSTLSVENKQE